MRHTIFSRLKKGDLGPLLLLASAVLLLYFGLWNAYFASSDDFYWRGLMRQPPNLFEALKGIGSGVRFLNFGKLWIETRVVVIDAQPYFWMSLIQHILVAWILYKFIRYISSQRNLAIAVAFIFCSASAYYEVITSISASEYSFWTIFYLLILFQFAIFIRTQNKLHYYSAVFLYLVLSLGFDFAFHLPVVLAVLHLTITKTSPKAAVKNWTTIRLHIPFWILWGVFIGFHFLYVFRGTSEVIYSEQSWQPGMHMITNLRYLVFLIIPNVHHAPIYNFLSGILEFNLIENIWWLSMALGVIVNLAACIGLSLGSGYVRLALALIYFPFFQYTLWNGDFVQASRYLYQPSIGLAMLIGLGLIKAHQYLSRREKRYLSYIVPVFLISFFIGNVFIIQTWVTRHIENGHLRRAFVSALASEYKGIKKESTLYIEVPSEKFTDLEAACLLVFSKQTTCEVFIMGARSFEEFVRSDPDENSYWLEATYDGVNQRYP